MNFEDIKVGMKVKIVAPRGFNLDEYFYEGEWNDVSYIPEHMKQYIGIESNVKALCFV